MLVDVFIIISFRLEIRAARRGAHIENWNKLIASFYPSFTGNNKRWEERTIEPSFNLNWRSSSILNSAGGRLELSKLADKLF